MSKIKAVLFDMDGVLVDSEPLHFEAHKRALNNFGIDLALDDYMDFGVAKGDVNLHKKVSEKYNIKIDIKKVSLLKKKLYREIFNEKAKPRDGILELISRLYGKYNLAIASSGARDAVEFVLERFNLKDRFQVVVSGGDVVNVKPAPDIYLKALELLNLGGDECVAIEDSETGTVSAKSAGIKCIAAPMEFTKNHNFSKADVVIENISDIDDKLLNNLG